MKNERVKLVFIDNNMDELPDDLLHLFYSYLSFNDILSLRMVSKNFFKLGNKYISKTGCKMFNIKYCKRNINNIVKTCCESNEAKSYKKSKDLDDYQYDFIESAINLGNEADSYHRHITDMESLESVLEEINYFRDLINKVSSKLQAYEAKAKDTLK